MADDPTREDAPQRFYGFDEDISGVAVPSELSILPLRGVVIFPSAIVPLLISRGPSLRLVEEALGGGRMLGLFSQKNPEEEHPEPEGLYSRGTAGRILKMLKYPDGSVRILVQGLKRIEVIGYTQREPYFRAKVRELQDHHEPSRSEEHTSELQSRENLVCRLLLEKKNTTKPAITSDTTTSPNRTSHQSSVQADITV